MKELYYAVFISTENKVYLLFLKINIKAINNVSSNGFTKAKQSINIIGFIDENYGNTRLYKAKKRIELRFTKKILNHSKIIEIYSNDKLSKEKQYKFQQLSLKYNLPEFKKELEDEDIPLEDILML
jgi:hypothetical protein